MNHTKLSVPGTLHNPNINGDYCKNCILYGCEDVNPTVYHECLRGISLNLSKRVCNFRVDFFVTEDFELFEGTFDECIEAYKNHPLGIMNIVEIDDDFNEVKVWL